MGRTGAWDSLVRERPPGSLVSGHNLLSVGLQIMASFTGQMSAVFYLHCQDWYRPVIPQGDQVRIISYFEFLIVFLFQDIVIDYDSTVIFTVSCFQYLSLATVFSKGPPYRKPFYTNFLFFTSLLVLGSFTALLYLNPLPLLGQFFELKIPDNIQFLMFTFLIVVANIFINVIIEAVLATGTWVKRFSHYLSQKKQPKNKYKLIQQQLDSLPELWPRSEES